MHPDDLKAIWICHECNMKFVFQGDDAILWAAEAENAHLIQDLIADTEVAKFNATKIVPLRSLQGVAECCKQVKVGSKSV